MKLSLQSPSSSQKRGALKAGRTGLTGEGVGQGVQAAEKWFWAQQFLLVCILLWNISFCLFMSPPPFFSLLPPPFLPLLLSPSLLLLCQASKPRDLYTSGIYSTAELHPYPIFKKFYFAFIYLFGGALYMSEDNVRCQFSPSTLKILRMKLRSSNLVAKRLYLLNHAGCSLKGLRVPLKACYQAG